jgi:hypothetical protein
MPPPLPLLPLLLLLLLLTCGGTMAGRRLANALRPALRPSRPRSGRCSAGSVSHLYLRAQTH